MFEVGCKYRDEDGRVGERGVELDMTAGLARVVQNGSLLLFGGVTLCDKVLVHTQDSTTIYHISYTLSLLSTTFRLLAAFITACNPDAVMSESLPTPQATSFLALPSTS